MTDKVDLMTFANENWDLSREDFGKKYPEFAILIEGNANEEGLNRDELLEARTRQIQAPMASGIPTVQYIIHFNTEGPTHFGRGPDQDIILDHALVSKKHATISKDDKGNLQLVDMGSTNGTEINTTTADAGQPVKLRDGDTIVFGYGFHGKIFSPVTLHDHLQMVTAQGQE